MKKFFVLFALISATAFAEGSLWESAPEFSNEEPVPEEEQAVVEEIAAVQENPRSKLPAPEVKNVKIANPKEHRGFYSNFSMGFSYANFHVERVDGSDYEEVSFNGFSFPLMDFRFGVAVANLIAFYTEFNFAGYMGSADDVEINCWSEGTECDVDQGDDDNSLMLRTYVGFGTAIYPFRDTNSVLNGFYLGGSIGYGAEFVYGSDLESVEAAMNLDWGFTVEIGKDWWLNDHLSIGIGAAYFHANPKFNSTGNDDGIDGFHIMLRLTRG